MKYGPLVFLAAFFAMASSWCCFVLTPQLQLGQLTQTNTVPAGATYPLGRPGLARQGLDVYRANGCAYCHSQQIGQTATVCNVLLDQPGTNQNALIQELLKLRPEWSESRARLQLGTLLQPVLEGISKEQADVAAKALSVGGGKASVWIVPVGLDIARGWGKRRTVAEDFLFDYPVMLGSERIGPDLANIALRQPDPNWHLRHLYSPRLEVNGSAMPPYRFLFETRKIERELSPEALALPAGLAPAPGYEIVPRPEAKALVAYLTSLQADAPLFDAPLTVAAAATTNAPVSPDGTSTNSPATTTNAPAK